jgi:hypothetical protein
LPDFELLTTAKPWIIFRALMSFSEYFKHSKICLRGTASFLQALLNTSNAAVTVFPSFDKNFILVRAAPLQQQQEKIYARDCCD